jgi:hypothetical protein
LIASLPVLSVWPTMVTRTLGSRLRPISSSTGRICGLMSARPVSKDTSLGTFSLSRLSSVRATSTPVPWLARASASRLSSMRLDQRLPATAPTAPPMTAPRPALPPVMEPMMAPATAPAPAPLAVPCSRSLIDEQPAAKTSATISAAVPLRCRGMLEGD